MVGCEYGSESLLGNDMRISVVCDVGLGLALKATARC